MRVGFPAAFAALATIIWCTCAHESSPVIHSNLESRNTDDEGWFDLSVSVRMKRDESSSSSPIEKRSETSTTSTPFILRRSPESGKLLWPRNFSEALKMAARNVPEGIKRSLHRRTALARRAMRVVITWYTGQDLLHPACFVDSDNWAPTDDSMVAAVTIVWPGQPPCGSFVRIQHHSDPSKHVLVRIVDKCGGCPPGQPHIDLTIGAFEKLYAQDVGLVEGLKAKVVSCPSHINANWSQEVIDIYGPKETIDHHKSSSKTEA
ncbi:hypothetical protein PGTUg99_007048 [Puccinia graminis f. sp. tritici]|uniref:RlpA-like protein double-psi beta-barrel domain-containing protein n=1 Tax=Puccinia graminis f. sp. tritici TaxID=56615 RepID=A0A5B0MQG0_PUCGR|nr:hypothetical protein PGTUg99_007048 [Puccinia graminis f. sp. tritici]